MVRDTQVRRVAKTLALQARNDRGFESHPEYQVFEYYDCMTLEEYCRLMKVSYEEEPSYDVVLAASYLQARGFSFCGNFGFENAVEIAEREYSKQCKQMYWM